MSQLLAPAYRGREASVMTPPPAHDLAVAPCLCAFWLSSKGIPHCDQLPPVPMGHLPTVNSSPRPGSVLQSLCSNSQLPHIPMDLCSSVRRAMTQIVWFSLHLDCLQLLHSSTASNSSFPSVLIYCPDAGIHPCLAPPAPRGRSGPTKFSPLFPFLPLFY